MGYGTYATIADLKGVLGITSTTDDVVMRKILEAASRYIDKYTNRYFYTTNETKYFDGTVPLRIDDLLTITTIKTDEDGNGTFENTLTVTTDYLLYPLNTYPKTKVELSIGGNYSSFGATKKGCEIAGLWGYGDGISTTPYTDSGTTLDGTLTVGATAVAVHSITPHSQGQTILVETEQMYVESIATTVLTVVRGVNGTTKATHADNIATYIYQYPSDIRQACIDLGVALYQNRDKQGLQSERLGDYAYNLVSLYSQGGKVVNASEVILESIRSYKRMRF